MDYTDLVNAIRERLAWHNYCRFNSEDVELLEKAADAIEILEIYANNYRKALEGMGGKIGG